LGSTSRVWSLTDDAPKSIKHAQHAARPQYCVWLGSA
jgi:hypothetical protein